MAFPYIQMYIVHVQYSGKGLRMIVLVSLIVLLRERLVSTIFCMVLPYMYITCTCTSPFNVFFYL